MDGFRIAGKAFCVVEDLRQFAEQHKGMAVAEWLKQRRLERIERAEAKQFGMSELEFNTYILGRDE
jgi:hypothetical protein